MRAMSVARSIVGIRATSRSAGGRRRREASVEASRMVSVTPIRIRLASDHPLSASAAATGALRSSSAARDSASLRIALNAPGCSAACSGICWSGHSSERSAEGARRMQREVSSRNHPSGRRSRWTGAAPPGGPGLEMRYERRGGASISRTINMEAERVPAAAPGDARASSCSESLARARTARSSCTSSSRLAGGVSAPAPAEAAPPLAESAASTPAAESPALPPSASRASKASRARRTAPPAPVC
mmetsp:Transcript_10642/g.35344  ORF Transcript_10642/g.35344 Transcript_10642/m.35344 type:complete len:245 (-) Transcript_10642:128-862(-)